MTADVAYQFRNAHEEFERAIADYLAISRGSHLYADAQAHAAAEEKAWDRMMTLRERADAVAAPEKAKDRMMTLRERLDAAASD